MTTKRALIAGITGSFQGSIDFNVNSTTYNPTGCNASPTTCSTFAGFLAAVACAAIWWQTGNPLWAALARAGAFLNLLNLIPIWMLDGGQAALALSKMERQVADATVSTSTGPGWSTTASS